MKILLILLTLFPCYLYSQITIDTTSFLYLTTDTGLFNVSGLPAQAGDEIDEWRDVTSGTNYVFRSPNAARRPTLVEINGDRWVDFTPGDYLINDNTSVNIISDTLNGLTEFSFYILFQSDVMGVDNGLFHSDNIDGSDDEITLRYNAVGACNGNTNNMKVGIVNNGCNNQIETSSNVQTTSPTIVGLTWNSGQPMYFYINGVLDDSSNVISGATNVVDQFYIGKGSKDNGGNRGWDGKIKTIIFYNTFQDSSQQSNQVNNIDTSTNTNIVSPPLYVKWGDFSVRRYNGYNELYWETYTEINNHGFEIQSGTDLNSIKSIDFIPGKGNSINKNSYKYRDYNIKSGATYYRLKQFDNNGNVDYSNTIQIQRESEMSIYPNIIKSNEYVYLSNQLNNSTIYIINNKGIIIYEGIIYYNRFKSPDIPGVYQIIIESNLGILTEKIIVN